VSKAAALALAACALLAGCATPPAPRAAAPAGTAAEASWSGRLALRVEDGRTAPLSAGFDLRGRPEAGELRLGTALGGTVAVLQWAPGRAVLRSGTQEQQFESLDALVAHVAGTALPVQALFDWLDGKPTEVPGWRVDLAQIGQGRLQATRTEPAPAADLRIALDR
jgi:outer membrane lipoprotein LolB